MSLLCRQNDATNDGTEETAATPLGCAKAFVPIGALAFCQLSDAVARFKDGNATTSATSHRIPDPTVRFENV